MLNREFTGAERNMHGAEVTSAPVLLLCNIQYWAISIHTLRMERDQQQTCLHIRLCLFQSTRSAWSVTNAIHHAVKRITISIHTLRMERDMGRRAPGRSDQHFNPHAPHGA